MTPLVPADVDLRGLHFMPLDVNRLRDSQLAINASGDEFRAAVLLWCASWNQIPAASLPSDDQTLAAYAGFGRDIKGWRKVKSGAMRGFVQCDDGRFYHPVVAEKALEAWQERLEFRERQDNDQERVKNYRTEHKALRDALRELGVTMPFDAKINDLRAKLKEVREHGPETETVTPETFRLLQPETQTETPVTVTRNATVMAKTGTGTGTGTEKQKQKQERGAQRAAATRGTRLPADWKPSEGEVAWARRERPDIDVAMEADKFTDHFHAAPGQKGVKLDWTATWRNWVRNAYATRTNGAASTHGSEGASPAAMRRLA